MPPKTKAASRKGKKTKNDGTEERRLEERERLPAEQEREGERTAGGEECSGVQSDAESTTSATGKQNLSRYDFSCEEEARLVEFFEQHDEFYNKGNPKYSNTQYKRKVLDQMAAELNSDASKIQGWFKNQRTQVGKMMNPHKKKSGSGQEVLTTRKKWQLSSFKFLRAYIVPRSYIHDTEQPEVPEKSAEQETGDGADDDDNEPSASCSVSGVYEGKRRKRPRTQTRMDEALLKFLERPRESEIVAQKMQERDLGLSAEREAFLQYFGSRLHRVSDEKWDSFSEEAHQMLRKYTASVTAPSASLGAPPGLSVGPPATHQLQSWQWPQPQHQQQQPAMPMQWQQWPQQQQSQWPQAQQIPAHQQPILQQSTQQPDIRRPGRPNCTPVQSVRQDDSLFDLSLPSVLSGSFTRMSKGSLSQPEPQITSESTMATSRNSGDDVSDEGGQE